MKIADEADRRTASKSEKLLHHIDVNIGMARTRESATGVGSQQHPVK